MIVSLLCLVGLYCTFRMRNPTQRVMKLAGIALIACSLTAMSKCTRGLSDYDDQVYAHASSLRDVAKICLTVFQDAEAH